LSSHSASLQQSIHQPYDLFLDGEVSVLISSSVRSDIIDHFVVSCLKPDGPFFSN